jgi:predicted nucleic acid binding AN1-type Zn finger protein
MAKPIGSETSLSPAVGPFEKFSTKEDRVGDVFFPRDKASMHSSGIKRCQLGGCRKRIPLAMRDLVCKCEKVFCFKHYLSENHKCSFDWTKDHQEKLTRSLDEGGSHGKGVSSTD